MAQQSVVALLDTMDELLPWLRDGDEQGWAMQEMEETALGGIAGVRNEERKDEKRKGGALGWMKRRMGLGREKGEEGEEEEDMAGWGKRYKAKVEEMTQTARRAEKVRAAVERFAAKVADGEHAPQRESYF